MKRLLPALLVCLVAASAFAVVALASGGGAHGRHRVEPANRRGELMRLVERVNGSGRKGRTPSPPCLLEDGNCVKVCAVPVASASHPRSQAPGCGTSASRPCRELVAGSVRPPGSSAGDFCAPANPLSLRVEHAPGSPRRR